MWPISRAICLLDPQQQQQPFKANIITQFSLFLGQFYFPQQQQQQQQVQNRFSNNYHQQYLFRPTPEPVPQRVNFPGPSYDQDLKTSDVSSEYQRIPQFQYQRPFQQFQSFPQVCQFIHNPLTKKRVPSRHPRTTTGQNERWRVVRRCSGIYLPVNLVG